MGRYASRNSEYCAKIINGIFYLQNNFLLSEEKIAILLMIGKKIIFLKKWLKFLGRMLFFEKKRIFLLHAFE